MTQNPCVVKEFHECANRHTRRDKTKNAFGFVNLINVSKDNLINKLNAIRHNFTCVNLLNIITLFLIIEWISQVKIEFLFKTQLFFSNPISVKDRMG